VGMTTNPIMRQRVMWGVLTHSRLGSIQNSVVKMICRPRIEETSWRRFAERNWTRVEVVFSTPDAGSIWVLLCNLCCDTWFVEANDGF
jgi:hypothetical protein